MKWGNSEFLVWLWLALPIAWIIWALIARKDRKLRELFDASILPAISPYRSRKRILYKSVMWICAMLLIGLALARPQWGFHWEEVKKRGLDIIVVLDASNSMLAEDIKPNRLQQAKWGIRDLVQRLSGDRIGLVSFAGSSFLQCPLTADYAAFLMTLDDVYAGIIPRGGTDIENALKRAVDTFEERADADRVILLITDGEYHEGDPYAILEQLKAEGIYLYSVGIGTLEGELIPKEDQQGRLVFLKDKKGRVIKSSLNETLLEKLAVATGGAYVRSTAGDLGLDKIIDQGIARLKRSEHEAKMMKHYEERFVWFLSLAFLCLFVEASINTRSRKAKEVSP